MWPIAIPILSTIAQNVLQGMNTRKARLYDSPAQQVKRFQEAGLPMASTSRITGGGGFQTQANIQDPSSSIQGNLSGPIKRQIDRKQLELSTEQIRSAKSAADIATGEAKNKLNPAGIFENTNQGLTAMQSIAQQSAAIKNAELINKWLPIEKAQSIYKNDKEINKIVQDTKNSAAQYNVIVSDNELKKILVKWQDKMSSAQHANLIQQNTNLKSQNEITVLQGEILRQTKMAQIQKAINDAINSGQEVAARQMNLLLQTLETESAKKYYTVRARADRSYAAGGEYQVFTPRDLMYLGMFSPKQSTMTAGQLLTMFK